MNVKVEKTEKNNEVKLSFQIEAEKFEEAIKKVFVKNAKYFSIPGFRKGKAPLNIVEKHYGSAIFYEDAFNELVPEIYENAVKENNLEVVSRPDIDITQMEKGKDLIFTAIVQTKPDVKLGKYKGIEIKKIEYNVSNEDIEHELEHMAERNSRLINVTDRPVEDGDTVIIDFDGSVDGVHFEGGKAENYELKIGSNTFIPGFEEQLKGMKIDEEKDIKVQFPKEYFSKDLAGKDAIFAIKLHEIKKTELPKIDDEFAKDVSEFDTIEELKKSIKDKLEKENEHRAKHEKEEEVINKVCEKSEVDIPSGMIELEVDNMINDLENRLKYQGFNLDKYLEMMGKTEGDMRKELEKKKKKNIKTRLVLESIIKAEKMKADPVKVEEKIEEMAKAYNKEKDELMKNESLKEHIENSINTEEVVKFLVENAKTK